MHKSLYNEIIFALKIHPILACLASKVKWRRLLFIANNTTNPPMAFNDHVNRVGTYECFSIRSFATFGRFVHAIEGISKAVYGLQFTENSNRI